VFISFQTKNVPVKQMASARVLREPVIANKQTTAHGTSSTTYR